MRVYHTKRRPPGSIAASPAKVQPSSPQCSLQGNMAARPPRPLRDRDLRPVLSPPRHASLDEPVRLPVLLYVPNLLCYARLLLSIYGLSMVIQTVLRQQEASRRALLAVEAANCSVQAVVQMATHYAAHAGYTTGLLAPIATTFLGKALAQASSALVRDMERRVGGAGETEALPTVEPDLLAALVVFLSAGALDLLDGVAARRMKQCSRLGALLDVVADNVLRGCMWVSSALLDARTALPALICISVEWLTLLASQLLQHREQGRHWKKLRASDPWIVRYFFSNNFRNVLGVYGVGSLFLAPLFPLCLHAAPGLGRRAGALSEGRGEGWGEGIETRAAWWCAALAMLWGGGGWCRWGWRCISYGAW
ncbi:hypothetical protein NSK_008440 [Nannochloropsis salina CCMP1776]|uniref:CDP-diacylglycerol--inositol 3-phosphatidyltransferase n=1 Tax=Nannochloropsis salina CCMP1776 TaxID=1027361 RepID=A0A4D9CQI0_9STRA|nr:hypothetical protein NSK_008440 [Nannochloropsis salina CCMP1776]|eukprot:TFJ80297.1 hypothetical protein NSK_008440 [Nannochloropsis salina CCMP1776]